MEIKEGQIYEGTISLSGSEDEKRRWIVVSPFGKTQIHAIDDPTEPHCWPMSLIQDGLRSGRLKFIETCLTHPVLKLQRAKEAMNIRDIHLGFSEETLNKMLELLEDAAGTGKVYTPYAAGEILEFMTRSTFSPVYCHEVELQVNNIVKDWGNTAEAV